ncbi:menaquinone biosynthetic enzyme MqnA/MqnD family protein [Paenibacillus sp. GCM10027627]|uniref:menaquinone biosynthetic enzyme MqnA/MqnD family protein n=1 Tax=unclassified Paenibacillus TaxID=185978 RepID=UPI00363A33A6
MGHLRPITIGEIDYANAWPLFQNFEKHAAGMDYEMVSKVPSELNRLLSIGELDLSAISSFSYGQYSRDYVLLPELSVGSTGRVHSILLFLKHSIEEKKPRKITVTNASETSVNLLKIIMAKRFNCEPEYVAAEPNLNEMLQDADAALLIGDPAIAASWRNSGLNILDLGELWRDWTGLGMTYAVVAARKSAIRSNAKEIGLLYEALLASKNENLSRPDRLIARACQRLGGDPDYWATYFKSLQYDFGKSLQEGLSLYFRYARELGLLKDDVEMTFFEGQSLQKVNE